MEQKFAQIRKKELVIVRSNNYTSGIAIGMTRNQEYPKGRKENASS